jgi:uncharacterized protein (UPF0264 family)
MQLLVSVRSAVEAEAALKGGAAVIDVKEPANGPLGRADDQTIAAVVRGVAGRRPVSAALGELRHAAAPCVVAGLSFVKWGIADCGDRPSWGEELTAARRRVAATAPGCAVVTVAYADWQLAAAPPVEEVVRFARQQRGGVLLLDTFEKNARRTLLDWVSVAEIVRICDGCRGSGVRVGLAGSLGAAQMRQLLPCRPDWFAVRGAACAGGERRQGVRADQVRELVALLAAGS